MGTDGVSEFAKAVGSIADTAAEEIKRLKLENKLYKLALEQIVDHFNEGCTAQFLASVAHEALTVVATKNMPDPTLATAHPVTEHDLHGYKHELGPCVCEECSKKRRSVSGVSYGEVCPKCGLLARITCRCV